MVLNQEKNNMIENNVTFYIKVKSNFFRMFHLVNLIILCEDGGGGGGNLTCLSG